KKSIENLFRAIRGARSITLPRFIYALGIRHIGIGTAKLISRFFLSREAWWSGMLALKCHDHEMIGALQTINGIGPKAISAMIEFLQHPENTEMIEKLLNEVVISSLEPTKIMEQSASVFAGKTLVFTGALESMSRQHAKAKAESLGARIASSISSKTDYVIVGKEAGSKLKAAETLGINILNETEWLTLIDETISR
ncbi:MAG: BRCT domain-containing protein, partial [Burkholderiales bacterium]